MTNIFENKTVPRGMRTSGESQFNQAQSFDNTKNPAVYNRTQNGMALNDFVDLIANESAHSAF